MPRLSFGFHRLFVVLLNQFLERGEVDVGQPVDIQTRFTGFVFAEFFQKFRIGRRIRIPEVERQVLFAGREANQAHIAFVAAGVGVVIAAETNDTAAPHLGLHFGGFLHELDDDQAVPALLLIGNAVHEGRHAAVILFRFEFVHGDFFRQLVE